MDEKKSLDIISGLLEGRAEIGCSDDMAEAMLSEFGRYKECGSLFLYKNEWKSET